MSAWDSYVCKLLGFGVTGIRGGRVRNRRKPLFDHLWVWNHLRHGVLNALGIMTTFFKIHMEQSRTQPLSCLLNIIPSPCLSSLSFLALYPTNQFTQSTTMQQQFIHYQSSNKPINAPYSLMYKLQSQKKKNSKSTAASGSSTAAAAGSSSRSAGRSSKSESKDKGKEIHQRFGVGQSKMGAGRACVIL